ncbi:MAG: hypothetical protein sGL2_07300 [Candidatus Mesenet longicola]|nr:MAG: hypothetical protein sGL2_07300 [Candidatus Mesenet longicola]
MHKDTPYELLPKVEQGLKVRIQSTAEKVERTFA